jgi:hypothetical protein
MRGRAGKESRLDQHTAVRKHLRQLLEGGQAHITLHEALQGFPVERAGVRPSGAPHSAWELLEHIRIAQEDILHFSEGPEHYVARRWPDDYWPSSVAPDSPEAWNKSAAAIRRDLAAFLRLVEDPKRDLFEPFPWGEGQTLFREAVLIADHGAYHLGQLMLVRRLLEAQ